MSTTEGKGQQEETIEIKKNIVIDASPEVVFKAITDPNELTNWFPDQAVLEPKVGGKMKFSFRKEENNEYRQGNTHEGTITEFILNKKISYTWEDSNEPDFPRTVVTWELEEIENTKTSLKLRHAGFKAGEKAKQYDEGWSHFLGQLAKYCEKRK
jgi:uncharacterized protein YndB with AHSA1/START domain